MLIEFQGSEQKPEMVQFFGWNLSKLCNPTDEVQRNEIF